VVIVEEKGARGLLGNVKCVTVVVGSEGHANDPTVRTPPFGLQLCSMVALMPVSQIHHHHHHHARDCPVPQSTSGLPHRQHLCRLDADDALLAAEYYGSDRSLTTAGQPPAGVIIASHDRDAHDPRPATDRDHCRRHHHGYDGPVLEAVTERRGKGSPGYGP